MEETVNKKRLFALGEWLEKYINPNAILSDYTKLSDWFINKYQIDFKFSSDDLSFRAINFVGSHLDDIENCMVDISTNWRLIFESNWLFSEKSDALRDGIKEKQLPKIDKQLLLSLLEFGLQIETEIKERNDEIWNLTGGDYRKRAAKQKFLDALSKKERIKIRNYGDHLRSMVDNGLWGLFDVFYYKILLDMILHSIFKTKLSWNNLFLMKIKESNDNFFKDKIDLTLKIPFSMEPRNHEIGPYMNIMLRDYNSMHKELSLDESSFHYSYYSHDFKFSSHELKAHENIIKSYTAPSFFPWQIAASRVLIDFLKYGGQKYITFCKHCGRFTLSKRIKPDGTPEKIFCSAKCRTAYKRV